MATPINKPALIAGAIAGGAIGNAVGFMKKGEELEAQGQSSMKQFTGATGGAFKGTVVGTGIGLGTTGTVMALRKIMGK